MGMGEKKLPLPRYNPCPRLTAVVPRTTSGSTAQQLMATRQYGYAKKETEKQLQEAEERLTRQQTH